MPCVKLVSALYTSSFKLRGHSPRQRSRSLPRQQHGDFSYRVRIRHTTIHILQSSSHPRHQTVLAIGTRIRHVSFVADHPSVDRHVWYPERAIAQLDMFRDIPPVTWLCYVRGYGFVRGGFLLCGGEGRERKDEKNDGRWHVVMDGQRIGS